MKKIVTLLLVIFLFTSCGTSKDPAEDLKLPIEMTVSLGENDGVFTMAVTEESCRIFFAEDHPLYGTSLYFDSLGGRADIGEFSRSVEINIFPAQKSLLTAVRAILSGNYKGTETEDGFKYTIDEMAIMVYYDKDTERIIGIRTEEKGRRYDFNVIALTPYEEQSNGAG